MLNSVLGLFVFLFICVSQPERTVGPFSINKGTGMGPAYTGVGLLFFCLFGFFFKITPGEAAGNNI